MSAPEYIRCLSCAKPTDLGMRYCYQCLEDKNFGPATEDTLLTYGKYIGVKIKDVPPIYLLQQSSKSWVPARIRKYINDHYAEIKEKYRNS